MLIGPDVLPLDEVTAAGAAAEVAEVSGHGSGQGLGPKPVHECCAWGL